MEWKSLGWSPLFFIIAVISLSKKPSTSKEGANDEKTRLSWKLYRYMEYTKGLEFSNSFSLEFTLPYVIRSNSFPYIPSNITGSFSNI
ncbi:hypothetical protein D3C75_682330 [compost metagenome]